MNERNEKGYFWFPFPLEWKFSFFFKLSVSSHQIFILENTKSHAVAGYIYHQTTNTNEHHTHWHYLIISPSINVQRSWREKSFLLAIWRKCWTTSPFFVSFYSFHVCLVDIIICHAVQWRNWLFIITWIKCSQQVKNVERNIFI